MMQPRKVLLTIAAAIAAASAANPSVASQRARLNSASATAPARVAGAQGPLSLYASLSGRVIELRQGGSAVAAYTIAVGKDGHPTPTGNFRIKKLVWNPGWVPPKADWARDKTAKAPGHPENPMKVVKVFFREPDYYIHGTSETTTLGDAASH